MAEKNGFAGGIAKPRLFWPVVTLLPLFLLNVAFTNNFLHFEVKNGCLSGIIVDILNRSTYIMIIALGLTLVIATKGIDISVGSVVAISGAIAGALAAAAILGLWNGFLVARLNIQPIVATLILMVAGRGIAQLVTNGQIITIYYKPYFFMGNSGYIFGLPFSLYIAAILVALTAFVTRKTALGLYIESVGANPTASRYAGINSTRFSPSFSAELR